MSQLRKMIQLILAPFKNHPTKRQEQVVNTTEAVTQVVNTIEAIIQVVVEEAEDQ